MLAELTIPTDRPAELALDHARLYALGLDHVRRLARRLWTDYNVHDPGVTTLELLCYTLMDLAYRASMPVEDLLAGPGADADLARQFPSARTILPTRPLTPLDYRRLLVDLPDVRNAWLRPAVVRYYADAATGKFYRDDPHLPLARPIDVRGVYDVLIDYEDGLSPERHATAEALVQKTLHANRNLSEDFNPPRAVDVTAYRLCCDLELAPDADAAGVRAEVLFRVQQYLSPPVRSYALAEMLGRRRADGSAYPVDEIFDGPPLTYGFIDPDELAEADLRAEVRLSDVIALIMDVAGVRAVRQALVTLATPAAAGPAADPPNPWLLLVPPGTRATLDRATCHVGLYKRSIPIAARAADVDAKYAALADAARQAAETERPEDLPRPAGQPRQAAGYYSFQNHFPSVYGLSEDGLPGNAGPRRIAQARQLKAYLLFFDQLMANYCAQLGRVRDLFSCDPDVGRSYFTQAVDSFVDADTVYAAGAAAQLETIIEDAATFPARRNRFLDHLIARFAERFTDYALVVRSAFGADDGDLAKAKCAFLADYPVDSRDRAGAYDRTAADQAALWDSPANVSGLERRLARLLGIPNIDRRNLSALPTDVGAAGAVGGSDEGMFVIEMLLLRPSADGATGGPAAAPSAGGDPMPDVCPDPTCTDCADDDPYSYRVHVLLPAYARRFANADFRRFVESVIREELPAHVAPRICWVDRPGMAAVETAYRDWLRVSAGLDDPAGRPGRLKALLDALAAARNVYPPQPLSDCDPGDDRPKFLLGRTALGTLTPPPAPPAPPAPPPPPPP